MARLDGYRKKAVECLELAETIGNPAERSMMLRIAQYYIKLADHVQGRRDFATAHRRESDRHPENDS